MLEGVLAATARTAGPYTFISWSLAHGDQPVTPRPGNVLSANIASDASMTVPQMTVTPNAATAFPSKL